MPRSRPVTGDRSRGPLLGWVTLRRYRILAIVVTAGTALITVAGGAVRLTGSGLGCDDWPNCNDTRFIDVSSGHSAIEQINRLASAALGLPTLLFALSAFAFARGRGLRWPAVGILVTILGNGVVGGMAVRGDLHPILVQSHFLLTMGTIAFGMIAIHRSSSGSSGAGSAGRRSRAVARVRGAAVALTVGTAAALATGTVVTGTGPHAGDEDIRRFGFDISNVTRTHSVTVLLTVAIALGFAVVVRSEPDGELRRTLTNRWSTWMFLAVVQGGIGYVQYFNGVPEVLVGAHIAGAAGLWIATLWLVLGSGALPAPDPAETEPSPSVTSETRESTSDQDPTTGFVSSAPGAV